jgi:Dna[CI] antecedent, DciA
MKSSTIFFTACDATCSSFGRQALGVPTRNRRDRCFVKNCRRIHRRALRAGILYVHVIQPALHYELEQISKLEILRKLKQRFGGRTIRDIRFRVG